MTNCPGTGRCKIGHAHAIDWQEEIPNMSVGVLTRIAKKEQIRLTVGCGGKATIGRRVRAYARKVLRRKQALSKDRDPTRRAFNRWFDSTFTSLVRPKPPGVYFYLGDDPIAFVSFDSRGKVVSRELIDTQENKAGVNLFITNHMGSVTRFDLNEEVNLDNENQEPKRGD